MSIWDEANNVVSKSSLVSSIGVVTDLTGLIVEGSGPSVGVGTTCSIIQGDIRVEAQVVGFRKDKILLMPLDELYGISPGASIVSHNRTTKILVNDDLLGRVIDPLGVPLDNLAPITEGKEMQLFKAPPKPLERSRIDETFDVGIKAVNSVLTVGAGQRVGVLAGSGVGKSTFLGMIAKHSKSSVNVIALVGERGREVREFIERDLGEDGLKRSVLVVATSDSSSLLRIRCGFVATAIAEYFRDNGHDVCLMLDSITRFCMAQREVGLAVGEPPSSSGYTPSVFAMLPKLLERAGKKEGAGTITAFYTVLVEGDDMNEPVTDAVRGILDGHIVLSRELAGRGHYPAIDVLGSLSRVMSDVVSKDKLAQAFKVREVLSDYMEAEDLINIGAYKEGSNPRVDYAKNHIDKLRNFLTQDPLDRFSLEESDNLLAQVFDI